MSSALCPVLYVLDAPLPIKGENLLKVNGLETYSSNETENNSKKYK